MIAPIAAKLKRIEIAFFIMKFLLNVEKILGDIAQIRA